MKKAFLFALALCLTASAATATPYVSGNLGLSIVGESDIEGTVYGDTYKVGSFEYNNGLALFGAIGSEFGNNKRIEIEIGKRNNEIDSITLLDTKSPVDDTEISALTFMVNAYHDFKTEGSSVAPFIGVGVGIGKLEIESAGESETDSTFGTQIIAGLGFAIAKDLNLDVQYRFLVTGGFEETQGGVTVKTDYMPHSILIGLRKSF